MYEENGLETIVANDGLLLLNEKHIEGGLDHKYLWMVTGKYLSDHRKHRCELLDEIKNNLTGSLLAKY